MSFIFAFSDLSTNATFDSFRKSGYLFFVMLMQPFNFKSFSISFFDNTNPMSNPSGTSKYFRLCTISASTFFSFKFAVKTYVASSPS